MRGLLFIATVFWTIAVSGQNKLDTVDWNSPEFASAKAYLYGQTLDEIIVDGKLHPNVVDTAGVELSSEQIEKAVSVVTGNNNGEEDVVFFCFEPHHGIVFYDTSGQIAAHISICFYCGQKKVYPETETRHQGLDILKEIIGQLGLPIFKRPEEYDTYIESLGKK